jgi:glycosyltransferase involved in cell wall biosynthesis
MEKRIWYTKSGNVDQTQYEDNGLLVPIKNAEALAEGIKRLLKKPDERLRLGARGRDRAEKEFNQEIIVQQTLNVYREMIITERLVAGKG